MTPSRQSPRRAGRPAVADRGTSPVVGVVLVAGLTVLLAATGVAAVGFQDGLGEPTPRASIAAEFSAADGWPDGQRLRLVHGGGEALRVADLDLVVAFPAADAEARLVDFPTRHLDGASVRGRDVFDGTGAGVDGALDAAETDGRWAAGESTSVRVAQHDYDVEPGDEAVIEVVHRPTGGVVDGATVRADG